MNRFCVILVALALGTAAFAAPGAQLPEKVSAEGALEKIPSPGKDRVAFSLFERGDHTYIGVASSTGAIRWHKDAGIRPLVSLFWSADGTRVMVVTDCVQPEAELHTGKAGTASWLFVLDATDGHTLAQGDLDTDVLQLGSKLPDAVGASHVIEILTLENDMISATIKHRGERVSGSAPLERLKAAKN